MNLNDFQALQKDIYAVFSALYVIDIDQLSGEQRKQHQQALASAYLALVTAENSNFNALSEPIKTKLGELSSHVKTMRQGVADLTAPHEKLGALAQGMEALAQLATSLRI